MGFHFYMAIFFCVLFIFSFAFFAVSLSLALSLLFPFSISLSLVISVFMWFALSMSVKSSSEEMVLVFFLLLIFFFFVPSSSNFNFFIPALHLIRALQKRKLHVNLDLKKGELLWSFSLQCSCTFLPVISLRFNHLRAFSMCVVFVVPFFCRFFLHFRHSA